MSSKVRKGKGGSNPAQPPSPPLVCDLPREVLTILAARAPEELRAVEEGFEVYASGGEEAFNAWLARGARTARERAREKDARETAYGNILRYILAYPRTDVYFESLSAAGKRVPSEEELGAIQLLLSSCNIALGGNEGLRAQNLRASRILSGQDTLTDRLAGLIDNFESAIAHAPKPSNKPPPAPEWLVEDIWCPAEDPHEVGFFLGCLRESDPAFKRADPMRLRTLALGELRNAKPASEVSKGGSGNSGAFHAIAELAVEFGAFGCEAKSGEAREKTLARAKTKIRRLVKIRKPGQGV